MDAIRRHDKLILCCSKTSRSSWWVKDEIRKAQERERLEGHDIIIPIDLDGHLLVGWNDGLASDVKSRFAPSFASWDSDETQFNKGLKKLLGALKADPG